MRRHQSWCICLCTEFVIQANPEELPRLWGVMLLISKDCRVSASLVLFIKWTDYEFWSLYEHTARLVFTVIIISLWFKLVFLSNNKSWLLILFIYWIWNIAWKKNDWLWSMIDYQFSAHNVHTFLLFQVLVSVPVSCL